MWKLEVNESTNQCVLPQTERLYFCARIAPGPAMNLTADFADPTSRSSAWRSRDAAVFGERSVCCPCKSRAGFRFPAFFVCLPAAEAPPGRSKDLRLILREGSLEVADPRSRRRSTHVSSREIVFFFIGGCSWTQTAVWRFFTEVLCCVLSSGCNSCTLAVRNKCRRASQ